MKRLIILYAFLATFFPAQMNASKYPALGVAGLGCVVAAIYYGCSLLPEPGPSEGMRKRIELGDLANFKLQLALAIKHDAIGLGETHDVNDRQKKRALESIGCLKQKTQSSFPDIFEKVNEFSIHFSQEALCLAEKEVKPNRQVSCLDLRRIQAAIREKAEHLERESRAESKEEIIDKKVKEFIDLKTQAVKDANKKPLIKYWSFLSIGTIFLCLYAHFNSTKN